MAILSTIFVVFCLALGLCSLFTLFLVGRELLSPFDIDEIDGNNTNNNPLAGLAYDVPPGLIIPGGGKQPMDGQLGKPKIEKKLFKVIF